MTDFQQLWSNADKWCRDCFKSLPESGNGIEIYEEEGTKGGCVMFVCLDEKQVFVSSKDCFDLTCFDEGLEKNTTFVICIPKEAKEKWMPRRRKNKCRWISVGKLKRGLARGGLVHTKKGNFEMSERLKCFVKDSEFFNNVGTRALWNVNVNVNIQF